MKPILIIGAAHLDIVGEYSSAISQALDKPGNIEYSVGGTAYNIAANIAQNGISVKFITLLKSDSLITPIITSRLSSYGIDIGLVKRELSAIESGFLAHREDGDLVSAVTATTMDHFTIAQSDLKALIESSDLVVVDCNISSILLNRIQIECLSNGKRLVVAGVSEVKAKKILQIERRVGANYPIFISSMTKFEMISLGFDANPHLSNLERVEICRKMGAENIIVTDGPRGFFTFDCTGQGVSYEAPVVPKIVSVTGGGDALLSAIIGYYYSHKALSWDDINRSIQRMVTEVLSVKGGTVDSQTRPDEMRVVPREEMERIKEKSQDHFIKAFGEPVNIFGKKMPLGDIFTILSLLIAGISLYFQI